MNIWFLFQRLRRRLFNLQSMWTNMGRRRAVNPAFGPEFRGLIIQYRSTWRSERQFVPKTFQSCWVREMLPPQNGILQSYTNVLTLLQLRELSQSIQTCNLFLGISGVRARILKTKSLNCHILLILLEHELKVIWTVWWCISCMTLTADIACDYARDLDPEFSCWLSWGDVRNAGVSVIDMLIVDIDVLLLYHSICVFQVLTRIRIYQDVLHLAAFNSRQTPGLPVDLVRRLIWIAAYLISRYTNGSIMRNISYEICTRFYLVETKCRIYSSALDHHWFR